MDDLFNIYHVYSRRTDGNVYLTPNFQVKEFACKDGTDPVIVNALLPFICQAVRNWFGYAFTPNSAYRDLTHNKKEGGSSSSYHVYGLAVDIPAKDGKATAAELYEFLDRLCGNCCELILYDWGVHIAVNRTKKRTKSK